MSKENQIALNNAFLDAAYYGRTDAAIAALKAGAHVSAKDGSTGLTALHMAVGTNNLHLSKDLVGIWKAPFTLDRFGRMPSVVAAECCASDELCDYIVEQEAKALGYTV